MGPTWNHVANPTRVPYGLPIQNPYEYPFGAHVDPIFFACWLFTGGQCKKNRCYLNKANSSDAEAPFFGFESIYI